MKNNTKKQLTNSHGFTLIETLVAILILTMSIGGLLALAAGGFYSVRYSKNQIIANNLLQESVEYIRHTRDDVFVQAGSFSDWEYNSLNVDASGNPSSAGLVDGCFSAAGCYVDAYSLSANIKECTLSCPELFYYPDSSFYGYPSSQYPVSFLGITSPTKTSFIRTIKSQEYSGGSQILFTFTISWLNGTNPKSLSQDILITNWK